jgi:hypothetical protein
MNRRRQVNDNDGSGRRMPAHEARGGELSSERWKEIFEGCPQDEKEKVI